MENKRYYYAKLREWDELKTERKKGLGIGYVFVDLVDG